MPRLGVDLPSFHEAASEFAARVSKGLAEFQGADASPLSRRVLQVWMRCFAWQGPELLQADVLVDDLDDDTFVELLAKFVWEHRHELARLVREEGEES